MFMNLTVIIQIWNRFKKEWLIDDYSDEAKVNKALEEGDIGRKVADVLLGILKRDEYSYPTEPSAEDINLLNRIYSQGRYS